MGKELNMTDFLPTTIHCMRTPVLLPWTWWWPVNTPAPWTAPLFCTLKMVTTWSPHPTAAMSFLSVMTGKLQTPCEWDMAASRAGRLPVLGLTMKYLNTQTVSTVSPHTGSHLVLDRPLSCPSSSLLTDASSGFLLWLG